MEWEGLHPQGTPVGLTNSEGNHGEDVKETRRKPARRPPLTTSSPFPLRASTWWSYGSAIDSGRLPETPFGREFDGVLTSRPREADKFYADVIPARLSEDSRLVVRQAFAGMLWSKQFYNYPVHDWLEEKILPPDCQRRVTARSKEWFFLESADILSMPDKWEYAWFAAWDLAFHCLVLARVNIDFAKDQFRLMTNQVYLHPNAQIPAYEWNFSDVNPPVHYRPTWQIYVMDKFLHGTVDRAFLESMFPQAAHEFHLVGEPQGRTRQQRLRRRIPGTRQYRGFRSKCAATDRGTLQADGTSWIAMFCSEMLTIAVELALDNPIYEDLACKFFEHFVYIAGAMDHIGIHNDELWDEEDGFYYDVLRLPRGEAMRVSAVDGGAHPLVRLCYFQLRHSGAVTPFQEASCALCRVEPPPDANQQSLRAGCGRPDLVVACEPA